MSSPPCPTVRFRVTRSSCPRRTLWRPSSPRRPVSLTIKSLAVNRPRLVTGADVPFSYAVMKIPADELEAVFRQKRPAAGETSRPAKRPRRREPARPAAARAAPESAREPAGRKLIVRVAPRPAATEVEEGEIPATTEATVVVLDEEETPAAAAVPEAGRVTVASAPPAAAGVERESTPPAAGAGGRTTREARGGEEAALEAPGVGTSDPPAEPTVHRTGRVTEGPGMVRRVRRITGMDNAVYAHSFLSGARTGQMEREMEGMTQSEFLDMIATSMVQMGGAFVGLREAVAHSSEAMVRTMARAHEYREESAAQAEQLARLQAAAKAREGDLASRLKGMEGRAAAAEARAARALEELKGALGAADAAGGRAAAAEKAAAEAVAEKAGAVAYADEANARAEEAEERAREAEARAKEAEEKARRVEAETKRAVADYKASDDFRQEVIEASLDAFAKGFEICKARIAVALKMDVADFDGVRPGGTVEEPAEEQESDEPASSEHGEEPAPGDQNGDPAPGEHDKGLTPGDPTEGPAPGEA